MKRIACDICGTTHGRLCWDHDHATGYVRGVLCTLCNVAIGMLDESPARLLAAVDYLQRPDTGVLFADLKRAESTENARRYRATETAEEKASRYAKRRKIVNARYANDPDFREAVKRRARDWQKKHNYKHQRAAKLRKRKSPNQLTLLEGA